MRGRYEMVKGKFPQNSRHNCRSVKVCFFFFFFFFGHAALAYAILVPRPGCGVLTTEPSGKFPRVAFWCDGSTACRGQGTQRSREKLAEKEADASSSFALHLLSLRMIYGSSE